MKRIYGCALAVAMLLLLSACGQKVEDTILKDSITTPEDGEAVAIYKKQCISCHAADLNGRVGPELKKVGSRLTDEQLGSIIREGAQGMPSYENRLEDKEIDAIVQWLVKMK
ncbi:cytochrome c [Paenibacillus sp. L3-i20]|uniref:c-type cytochrome n=1 Tax=Paenibacillus sp. L3-i20 TaxID=2905833 RepID=UPI001EDDBC99|nr:cytochrome c [Paenibacillus sp. L3-i20]GKU79403.1 hypothetical protein L3i20_v238000 [Paenibacillus sp. L3-i20]